MTYQDTVDLTRRSCRSLTVLGAAKLIGVHRLVLYNFLNGGNITSRHYFTIITHLGLLQELAADRPKQLTIHEMTIVRNLSKGLCRKEIAAEVRSSVKGVDIALKNIARKIGLQEVNVALITRFAIAKGI